MWTTLAVALIVLAAAAVVMLAIMPLFQEAGEYDERIAQAEVDLQTANALLARRQGAKAQAAQSQVELMRIANQVPDSPHLPSVIIDLQDAANAAGLRFSQISPGALEPGAVGADGQPAAYSKVSTNAVVRGDWADVIDFTRRLHAFERAIRLTQVNVTYQEATETERAGVTANYTAEVYVMAAAASTPGASAETTPTP